VPTPESSSPLGDLLRRAARRHGVVDLDVADQLGLTRQMLRTAVRNGLLLRRARGVYVASGSPPTWKQDVLVATTATGGVASHRCAARLHRLDGFATAPVEVTVGAGGTRRELSIVHRTPSLDRSMVTRLEGIPTTSIARTLVDLGAVVDDDRVEQALDDALRRGANLRWISQILDSSMRPGPTGWAALARVLARPDRTGPMPDSMFERLVERIVTAAGLPPPQRQVRVLHQGREVARIDAAWPHRRLGLEADSELWHWGPRRGRLARRRHNLLVAAGWQMTYASWQDTNDPDELIARLSAALLDAA